MDLADIGSELEITLDFYPPQGTQQGSVDPEGASQWMPGYCEAYSSPGVYVIQDSAAILEELTCPEFEYGNTDSDSESDDVLSVTGDDGHPSIGVTPESGLLVLPPITVRPLLDPRRNGSLSPSSREEKNNRERVRIVRKREKLKEAKDMAVRSALIDEEAKKHRWTEEYTLKQIRKMIATLEGQFKQYGCSSRTPRPLARKAAPRGCRRPPNSFLRFSQALRPSFLAILKTYLHPEKNKEELEQIQVSTYSGVASMKTVRGHCLGTLLKAPRTSAEAATGAGKNPCEAWKIFLVHNF